MEILYTLLLLECNRPDTNNLLRLTVTEDSKHICEWLKYEAAHSGPMRHTVLRSMRRTGTDGVAKWSGHGAEAHAADWPSQGGPVIGLRYDPSDGNWQ